MSRFFNTKKLPKLLGKQEKGSFIMTEFKPIETQEELDQIIQGRLARQKESLMEEFNSIKTQNDELTKENASLKGTIEDSSSKLANFDKEKNDLMTKIAGYETAKLRTTVAIKAGLPYDLADRLVGEDEETLTADAQRLASFVKQSEPVAPLKDSEPPVGDSKENGYRSLVQNLNFEGE